MKTAGQDFLEWYNDFLKTNGCSPSDYDVNFYWNGGNLQKEKQQFVDFSIWFNNNDNSYKSYNEIVDKYYDSTFGCQVEEAII